MIFDNAAIAQHFLIWRSRGEESLIEWPSAGGLERRFAEHLASVFSTLHLADIQTAVVDFGRRHPSLVSWFDAVLEPFRDALFFEGGAPRLRRGHLARWRDVTSNIDPDALLTLTLARQGHSPLTAQELRERLPYWGYYISTGDHGLERVLRRGIADIHVHFEASDPLPLLWLRLARGRVAVAELSFFSDATVAALSEDRIAVASRLEDRNLLEGAAARRSALVRSIGFTDEAEPATPLQDLACERSLLVRAWKSVLDADVPVRRGDLIWALDRYLIAKHLFLRRHQQRAGRGPGLTRFRDFLDRGETIGERQRKANFIVRKMRYDRMLSLAASSPNLRVLELRMAPQKTVRDWARLMSFWQRIYAAEHPNVRFVVHFIRKDGPKGLTGSMRDHAGLRRVLDRQSAVLQVFRAARPDLARFIVGVDVANLERGFPPQLFAPYLQLLRGRDDLVGSWESEAVSNWRGLRERAEHLPARELPALGLTYHAGEDFYHPLDGLQAVGGLIEHVMQPGDRIGHGLIVGWDLEGFERSRGRLPIPTGQLLDDLVWVRREAMRAGEWTGACQHGGDSLIRDLSLRIYELTPDPQALERTWSAMFRTPLAEPRPDDASELRLAYANVHDGDVVERRRAFCSDAEMQTLSCVHPLMPPLQAILARRVRDCGIVIEACPTSNLVTGAVERLSHHPMLAYLRHLDGQQAVTINTDDPGVFGTTIEIEYALMFDALLEKYDRQQSLEHIDRARHLALESAFDPPVRSDVS